MIATAKDRSGVPCWDSPSEPDNLTGRTLDRRDPLRELARAVAEAEGGDGGRLAFGVTYSLDDARAPLFATDRRMSAINARMRAHWEELTSRHAIEIARFADDGGATPEDLRTDRLAGLVRSASPRGIVNDRMGLGGSRRSLDFDFRTFDSEREIPASASARGRAWEVEVPMRREATGDLRSRGELIGALTRTAAMGGNALYRVHPRGDGTIGEGVATRLREVGAWMAANGASIRGVEGSPFSAGAEGAPVCTRRGNRLYVFLDEPPARDRVWLPGLANRIVAARILSTGEALPLQDDQFSTVRFPERLPGPLPAAIELELDGEPVVID